MALIMMALATAAPLASSTCLVVEQGEDLETKNGAAVAGIG
jgi:hypothetical protein